jgi:hypothetical protein
MDVNTLHNLIAGMHQSYYDRRGLGTQIEIMLCALVGGQIGFVEITATDRDDWYAKASAVLAGLKADAYCVVSEAWAAVCPPAGDPVGMLRPSQRENRREVIVTVCVDRDGARASSVKLIERAADGRVAALIDMADIDMVDGEMFRLF